MGAFDLAIFDFDGTLADSMGWFADEMAAAGRRHGFRTPERNELQALRGLPARRIVAELGVPLWKLPIIAADMRARKLAAAAGLRLFDGVAEALEALASSGVRLAVVSSDSEASVRTTLGPDLERLIGRFECGADLFGKAAKFRRVLKAMAVSPSRAITIGDEDRDALAAREAGVAFAAVTWGFATPAALLDRGPALVFNRPSDFLQIAARPGP